MQWHGMQCQYLVIANDKKTTTTTCQHWQQRRKHIFYSTSYFLRNDHVEKVKFLLQSLVQYLGPET